MNKLVLFTLAMLSIMIVMTFAGSYFMDDRNPL